LKILLKLIYYKIFVLLLLFLGGCTEPDNIGMDIQPEGDLVNVLYTDTTTVKAYTVAEDSVITDEILYNLLGNYNDPVFGKVSASFYTQIRLSANNIDFGPNPVCDSIILTLAYKGFYGDTLTPLTIQVYELLESIYLDSSYNSKSSVPHSGVNLAQNISYYPRIKDSVTINGIKMAPHLRVKLNNSFGNYLINASNNLQNNVSFTQFFKGLYVTTTPVNNGGVICYFDLLSSLSQVTLYYHNDNYNALYFNFVIDQYCARFNTFDHFGFQNAVSPLKQQLLGNLTSSDSVLFVQAMAGTKIKVQFPYIKDFILHNNIAISNAELVMVVDNNDLTISDYSPPLKLLVVRELNNGAIAFLPDYYEGESFYGGNYNETKKEYRFRITKYIQGLINGTYNDDKSLNIIVSGSSIKSNRVVLKGFNRMSNKSRLIITYINI